MSTVKADNFTWKSGQAGGLTGTNVTGDQIVYGVAKSWCNYLGNIGSSTTVNKSFNISSVTDNGTGDQSFNFTNSFVDTYYVWSGSAQYDTSISYPGRFVSGIGSITVSTVRVACGYTYNSTQDCTYVHIIVTR